MENALYDFIHSLRSIRKLTRSLRSLIRFLILLNSRIKIVRAHFPWSNLYFSSVDSCFHLIYKSLPLSEFCFPLPQRYVHLSKMFTI